MDGSKLTRGISGFDKLTLLQCLYEVGKYRKITLLDLYCEVLEPEPRNSSATDHMRLAKDNTISMHNHRSLGFLQNEGYVVWAFQILR